MKSNLDHLFKTSKESEQDGIWFTISDEVGFLIKRFGGFNSSDLKKAMASKYKPFANQIKMGTLDPEKEREIMVEMFVEACVVDWKGVEIDGEERSFSKSLAVEFLIGLPDLFETLVAHASDFNNFKEDLGNS